MLELIARFWYLWLLVLLAALFQLLKPTIKGWIGEKTVSAYLSMLPKEEYIILNDLILPTETKTTQIDHVVISPYGIFVIETKNYNGRIYGSEKSAEWIQNIYGKKSSFMNPIRQNYAHVKAIEAILTQYPNVSIIPIVAFSSSCNLKVKAEGHVTYFHHLCKIIRGYKDKVLENTDVAAIADLIQNKNIASSTVKKDHIAMIKDNKKKIQNLVAGNKCPKCTGTLVERNRKWDKFLGCSNYPKCRFTKQL